MKRMKRITGMLLAIVMVLGMVPVYAVAATEYTGVELRVQDVSPDTNITETQVTVKAATDADAKHYSATDDIAVSGKWYHLAYLTSDIPTGEETLYSEHNMGAMTVYIKEMTSTEKFNTDKMYLYIAELTMKNGATLAADCEFQPGDNNVTNCTSTSATISIEVSPSEMVRTIQNIEFTCDDNGNLNVKNYNPSLTYVYYTRSGKFDVDVLQGPIGEIVGTASINTADFKEWNGLIDLTNAPQIVLAVVDANEWKYSKTAEIQAYGIFTVPMSSPYITVNSLTFNEEVEIIELGTIANGRYDWDIAQATFEGWYLDKEGKVPATVEQDAYAIFNLRSYGLFADDIKAEDFVLKSNFESYNGTYLFPQTESNAYKVAFFVPSTRISVSLQVIGEGGALYFWNNPDQSTISLTPSASGNYDTLDIGITIKPGYYAKSLKVNGEVWNDSRNPFTSGKYHQISNTENYETGIASFNPTTNTVITLELAPADKITIDYGDNMPAYSNDEYRWHSNGQYFVSETYSTQLCGIYAFNDPTFTKHVLMLNTAADGSGTTLSKSSTHYVWNPTEEYSNGKSDSITVYVIMECNEHTEYGAEDNAWQYFEAKDATCTENGYVAHRYCPNCGIYQTKNSNGTYVFTPYSEIVIEKLPHVHKIYKDNGDGTHSIKCENCDDAITENHKVVNGECVCGYREYIIGDVNEDGVVSDADAVYLLYHTIFAEDYPVRQPADFDGDGVVSDADAVHLLYHTIFPEDYPLN